MDLSVSTDRNEVSAAVSAAVGADPVRNTLLGTMLDTAGEDLWCAVDRDRPGTVAVRSDRMFPVVLTPGWTPADASELAEVISDLPDLRAVSGGMEVAGTVADAVAARTGRTVVDRRPERLYRLDHLADPAGVAGSSRTAGPRDRALLTDWLVAFAEEVHAPVADPRVVAERLVDSARRLARLWVDPSGRRVALAARRAAAGGVARIGPVFTPPSERGHGYAAAVTAVISREILDEGAVPVLFTDATDPVPNRLYTRLGYQPVRDLERILFG